VTRCIVTISARAIDLGIRRARLPKANAVVRRRYKWVSAALAATLVFAACGDDGSTSSDNTQPDANSPTTTGKQPVAGGTITFGTYSETAGLDPIVSSGNGVTGYIEMNAVYDTIVRYNVETGKYEPNTARA
jgi:peptide/nickel transport system substrate-binding protein